MLGSSSCDLNIGDLTADVYESVFVKHDTNIMSLETTPY